MNGPLAPYRGVARLLRAGPARLLLRGGLALLAAAAACAHRPDPFFYQYAVQVAQVCAQGLPVPMTRRELAEELERCYFDAGCEIRLCLKLAGPAVVIPPSPPKPDA